MDSAQPALMTEGDLRRRIITFAVPIFIGSLFQQLYNTADSLIVGNLVGSAALAAVSSTSSIVYLAVGFFMGFSMGAGIVIARHIGTGNHEMTQRSVHTTVAAGLVLGIVMTVISVLAADPILRATGTPDSVFADASAYLHIYFLGMFALVMYNTFVGILQAAGDSRHPLCYLIISSCVNIVLDLFMVGTLKMGVAGAAYATIFSELLSACLSLRRLMMIRGDIHVDLHQIRFDPEELKQIVRYGFPTAMQSCVIDLSNVLIQSYINSFGQAAMAGIGAYTKIEGFAFLPVTSFSMAMSTFVSQNRGAGRIPRMKDGIRFGLWSAVISIEIIGLIFFLFAPQLIGAFSSDPEVIAYGVGRARVVSLFFCLLSFSHVTSAVMRGVGRPAVPMAVMLTCWCAVRVTVLMTIGRMIHVIALSNWIYPFTWSLSSLVYLFYLRKIMRSETFDQNS
jgi:putative MATE family efflux protein